MVIINVLGKVLHPTGKLPFLGRASTGTLVTQPVLSCSEATSKLLSWAQNRGGSLGFEVRQVQVCHPGPAAACGPA